MACASVGTDVLESLDVVRDIALQIALELKTFDDRTDLILFLGGEVVCTLGLVDLRGLTDVLCARKTDTVERSKREGDSFVRKCDT